MVTNEHRITKAIKQNVLSDKEKPKNLFNDNPRTFDVVIHGKRTY